MNMRDIINLVEETKERYDPDEFADALSAWVKHGRHGERRDGRRIELESKLLKLRSLAAPFAKPAHQPLYRGLRITSDQYDHWKNTGNLRTNTNRLTSWTYKENVAMRFTKGRGEDRSLAPYGAVVCISHEDADVFIDIEQIWKHAGGFDPQIDPRAWQVRELFGWGKQEKEVILVDAPHIFTRDQIAHIITPTRGVSLFLEGQGTRLRT